MNDHIRGYFCEISQESPGGHFHKVISLGESPHVSWSKIHKLAQRLPKGWYELAQLPMSDRIDFLLEFWMSRLPFHPQFHPFIEKFFRGLGSIGVYVTQKTVDDAFEAHLVYGLKKDRAFFHGSPPAAEHNLVQLQRSFPEIVLPNDYLAFLQIHDGFAKFSDSGVISCTRIPLVCAKLQKALSERDTLLNVNKEPVNPKTLLPFYEAFDFSCYQCFWSEWYPDQEMGNVYYSGLTNTISDHTVGICSPENQAFPTFLDWLLFYLETMEV